MYLKKLILIRWKKKYILNIFSTADGYHQQAAVPLDSETHGGEDVGVYSSGPFSHLLTGVFEQSYIAHIIMWVKLFVKVGR